MSDAVLPQQSEGGIATGGEIGGCVVRAGLTGVFTQGHVADVVQPILELPMTAPQLFQPGGIRLLGRQAGQGVRPLLA
jgi:hypothetical protein